jgi:cysteine-rich repeat protein
MKRVLVLLLLLAGVLAAVPPDGSWVVSPFTFGGGKVDITPSLEIQDGNTLGLKLSSTVESKALFKLWRVFPHPAADSFEIDFEAKIDAPNIDLDRDKQFSGGEGDNSDGPNLFAFAYSFPNATTDNFGTTKDSLTFYTNKVNATLCHVHFECNWVGDIEQGYGFYCPSETVMQGWLADGYGIGVYGTNQFSEEPFEVNEWKTVRLNFQAGECVSDNMSLMIMGVDAMSDRPYTWEFRNFQVIGADTETVKFDDLYTYSGGEYAKVEPPAYCGDRVKNGADECDGSDGESEGLYCQPDCTLKPRCGDNYVAGGEKCDGLKVTKGFTCSADCTQELNVCGDGMLVGEEVCDPGVPPAVPAVVTEGFACSADCKAETSICGDGIVVGTEECDGNTSVPPGHNCYSDCTLYRVLKEDENAIVNKIVPLALEADTGKPAISEMKFLNNGTLTIEDLRDQVKQRNVTALRNVNFSFCTSASPDCEANYLFSKDFNLTASSVSYSKAASGLMKVYKVKTNTTTEYLIGFKHEIGLFDFLSDPAFWLAFGGIILVLVIGAGLVVVSLVGFFLYARSKGMGLMQAFSSLFRRRGL